MLPPAVAAAFDRGAYVVTPNKRLARDLVVRHDEAQRAAGRTAWPAARAMPWGSFVGELWQRALDAGLDLPPHRLDEVQATHLWRGIVAADLRDDPLLDASAATALVREAWERVCAYGAGGEAWRGFAAGNPEVDAFVRWADAYERGLRRLAALDLARAPDALVAHAARLPGIAALDVALVGFVERSPQQERLLAALAAAGARVQRLDDQTPAAVARGRLHAAPSTREELVAALSWARARATSDPAASVAIVVHDLHERRELVRALAEDILCPGLQWPAREVAPRPYDISAAGALADVPVVAAALDLIALAHGALERSRVAALLRSRYVPGMESVRWSRATVERKWLEQGRRTLTLRAVAGAIAAADPALATRWSEVAARPALPAQASPREFVEAWRRWLEATGWCEDLLLDSAERAARGAWFELGADFARLTAVTPKLSRADALQALREAAQDRAFEPESPAARVRILGVLEAAGLAFDAAWVAGLSAEAWPRAPQPNPLLPIDWQRQRDVPRASAARELAFARTLTAQLDSGAREVVFSYAERLDDHASKPSPLVAHLPALAAVWPTVLPPAHTQFAARPALDRIADASAPALEAGVRLRGGASLIEQQSACPFQAFGRQRLRAEGWPDTYAGLAPTERGRFLHAAFAAFWNEVGDQATLRSLDEAELDARLARAVATGRAAIDAVLWNALPPVVAAVEVGHVARVMKQWLREVDATRPPFAVERAEAKVELTLAGHPLDLRIDRVDQLADGGRAIIDYKSGRAVAPKHWFEERPQAPQLALYAMALAQHGTDDVAALAYAQLRSGAVKAVGVAEEGASWAGLVAPAQLNGASVADWPTAKARLRGSVIALAEAVRDGDARIDPRDRKVCTRCDLGALCRIAAQGAVDEAGEGEEDAA